MKPTGLWLKHLALAGSCLVWAGCGGSDVPDPDSDSRAASESTPKVNNQPSAPPEAPEPTPPATEVVAANPAPAPTAPTPPAASAEPPKIAATAPEVPAVSEPPPATDPVPTTATATAKGDTSGTDEMLRIASTPSAAAPASSEPTAGGGPPPAAGATSPPQPAISAVGGRRPPAMSGSPGADARGESSPSAKGEPDPRGRNPEPVMAAGGAGSGAGGRGGMAESMAGAGFGAGGAGAPAPAGDDPGPNAFRYPGTAVQAFLSALRAKNKDRLSQATARRAATEAVEKNRKIFAAILEQSISDEELDDMAKALQQYQVSSVLAARSTGQTGVLITRSDQIGMQQRTVMVRKEKEGWKVLDFSGVIELKNVRMRNPFGRR